MAFLYHIIVSNHGSSCISYIWNFIGFICLSTGPVYLIWPSMSFFIGAWFISSGPTYWNIIYIFLPYKVSNQWSIFFLELFNYLNKFLKWNCFQKKAASFEWFRPSSRHIQSSYIMKYLVTLRNLIKMLYKQPIFQNQERWSFLHRFLTIFSYDVPQKCFWTLFPK